MCCDDKCETFTYIEGSVLSLSFSTLPLSPLIVITPHLTMHSLSVLTLVLASASALVAGSPLENSVVKREAEPSAENDIIDHIVFKRGDVLSPRDLLEAEELGVDVEQSMFLKLSRAATTFHTDRHRHIVFKHSMMKRSNGENITFWLHNSWQDEKREEAPPQSKNSKRGLHIWEGGYTRNSGGAGYKCDPLIDAYGSSYANSPYTGGVNNILTWSKANQGYFDLRVGCCPYLSDIIISGSNNGANAAYSVQPWKQRRYLVGSSDIADGVRLMRDRYQKKDTSGSWRVQGGGILDCREHGAQADGLIDWVFRKTDKKAG